MRHIKFIIAAYQRHNIDVSEELIVENFNIMKRIAEECNLAQATFAGVLWSIRIEEEYSRVSLFFKDYTYAIYDGKDYEYPSIIINPTKANK